MKGLDKGLEASRDLSPGVPRQAETEDSGQVRLLAKLLLVSLTKVMPSDAAASHASREWRSAKAAFDALNAALGNPAEVPQ